MAKEKKSLIKSRTATKKAMVARKKAAPGGTDPLRAGAPKISPRAMKIPTGGTTGGGHGGGL